MALLIPYDGDPRIVRPGPTPRAFTLPELQTIVGGYIEAVYLRAADGERLVMFINEDGKRLQLPLNHRATAIARPFLQPIDVIVGHAILCTLAEAGEGREAADGETNL